MLGLSCRTTVKLPCLRLGVSTGTLRRCSRRSTRTMKSVRRLPIAVLIACALLLHAAPARAYVPEQTPRRHAEAAARAMLAARSARPTSPGVLVARGGVGIISINADEPFVPASLLKLATTTAAIVRFGPNHRFPTRVLTPRSGGSSTVASLYLVGGGDPTFSTEAYRRKRYEPKPTDPIKVPAFPNGSPTVEQLARRVAAARVRVVRGDLIVDETLFDARRTPQGWLPSYLGPDPDSGLLSAMPVNEGRADLAGKVLVKSPAAAAGEALKRALAARGVAVRGKVRLGRAPRGAVEVARVQSPTVRDLVAFINTYSINFHAELLLKSLGAAHGGAGSTEAGVRVVRETLGRLGIPLEHFTMTDGSGLSILNRMTPRTIAGILDRMVTGSGPGWDALRDSMAVAGRPGTLLRRMRSVPAGGNLRGKTGQIRMVRAMAGWATGRDGVPVVYVTVFNRAPSPFALTTPMDAFGQAIAGYPGR